MTWGTGPWGATAWGGGDPSTSGAVHLTSVRYIGQTYLRLHLNTQVIVNEDYLNPENYTLFLREDSPVPGDEVRVVRVFPPSQDVLVADYIYVETTRHTEGATYDVSFTRLQTLDGVNGAGLGGSVGYAARVTKTMIALKNVPSHFDKRLDSLLHALVTAISLQDDTIGGSRSDEFP